MVESGFESRVFCAKLHSFHPLRAHPDFSHAPDSVLHFRLRHLSVFINLTQPCGREGLLSHQDESQASASAVSKSCKESFSNPT